MLPQAIRTFSFYRQQTVDLPPIQRCAAVGDFTPSEGVGVPPSGGGDKRGQGTDGSLSPLDTPDLPLSRRIEDARLNGGYGGTIPGVFQLICGCNALNFPCVIRRA